MRNEASILSISCDLNSHNKEMPRVAVFHSDKVGEARHLARKMGWKIGTKDFCPTCHEKWKAERAASRKKRDEAKRMSEGTAKIKNV